MNSGGAYYQTAAELRLASEMARRNYAEALGEQHNWSREYANGLHPSMLVIQAVGFEIAAAIYCLAQAVEDSK